MSATLVKKDVSITAVTVNKTRKKLTSFGFDPNTSTIIIQYDVYALDSLGNELAVLTSNNGITIPQSRFAESLIAAWLTASNNLILNEF